MRRWSYAVLGAMVVMAHGEALLAASESPSDKSLALSANGLPVVELYRSGEAVRYSLDDDWLVSLSLGISPEDLVDRPLPWSHNNKWRPPLAAYARAGRPAPGAGPAPVFRKRTSNWYWTTGTNTTAPFRLGNSPHGIRSALDIRADFIQEFSLQTQAGFVIPFGKSWSLGSAITLDRQLGDGFGSSELGGGYISSDEELDAGAYVGIEWRY